MERYSRFRDRGYGVAPFLPVGPQPSSVPLLFRWLIFLTRLPVLLTVGGLYFLLIAQLPIGSGGRKAALWTILLVAGVWWVDLQIDGVKRGSLAKQHRSRLPQAGSVIAASFASPIDPVYLAAIFDPIFTASYPNTRQVEQVTLWQAIQRALHSPRGKPSPSAKLTNISSLLRRNPGACVVILPECTTTNGRAILPLSPSLLATPPTAKIFPVNLRYTPADVTTPISGEYGRFAWNLCSRPTHCIRVRLAEYMYNRAAATPTRHEKALPSPNGIKVSGHDDLVARQRQSDDIISSTDADDVEPETNGAPSELEREVLDRVADALARLGRVSRVSLTVEDKVEFVRLRSGKKR